MRANEKFSGKGHARHVCKDCERLPRAERDRVQALMDIERFLIQSSISARNVARLKSLRESPDVDLRPKAELVLEVAALKPHRRRRIGYLRRHAPELLKRLTEEGLLFGASILDEAASEGEEEWDEIAAWGDADNDGDAESPF